MSDTSFVARTTGIVATWLNSINKLAWWGRSPIHVTSTGTANAHVITLPNPSLYSTLTSGDRFTYKAHAANTGSMTLQVLGASSLAATTVHLGGAVLSSGAIQIGDIVEVAYNGTVFQIVGGNPLARFLQSGSGAIARTSLVKQQERVSLEDYGADPEGVSDSTVAFQNATARLAALGGGVLVGRNGGSYTAWGANTNNLIAPTTGTRGIAFEGNGCLITSSLVNDATGVFLAALNNIGWFHIEGVRLVGGNASLAFTTGEGLVDAWNGSKNISIEGCSMTNARQALRTRHATGDITGARVRGVRINGLDMNRVYYGLNCQFNGDDIFARGIRSINGGRAYLVYNVRNHDVAIYSEHGGAFSDCVVKVYGANALTAYENTTADIKVDYQSPGRYTGSGAQTAGEAVVEFMFQQYTSTTSAATMKDIDVHLDVAALSAAAPYRLCTFTRYDHDETATGDGTSRSYVIKNISVSGTAKDWDNAGSDGAYLFSGETVNSVAMDWDGDSISNIKLEDLDIAGDPTGEAIYINGQGFADTEQTVSLRNVRVDGDIFEVNVTAGMISYENVKSNNKNRLSQRHKIYAVTWTGASVNPAIGDGTLKGSYSLKDGRCQATVEVVIGSTTTTGTGAWSFSLPFTSAAATILESRAVGSAVILDNTTAFHVGSCVVSPNSAVAQVFMNATGDAIGSGTGLTWATGDYVSFTIDYPIA